MRFKLLLLIAFLGAGCGEYRPAIFDPANPPWTDSGLIGYYAGFNAMPTPVPGPTPTPTPIPGPGLELIAPKYIEYSLLHWHGRGYYKFLNQLWLAKGLPENQGWPFWRSR